jgi:methylated-DNA-[protein]-cysteine S-methyltransferase
MSATTHDSNRTDRREPAFDDAIVDRLLHKAHAQLRPKFAIIRRPEVAIGVLASPLGRLMIAEGARGLVMIHYMDDPGHTQGHLDALRRKFDPIEDVRAVEPIVREIRGLLSGKTGALTHEVDLSLVESPFRRDALKRLCEVPSGAVVSYQALAAVTGAPNAQRAIGSAMANNPIPIYVPCHRVVRSDGSVGNYGGGPSRKIKLLRAEGFQIDNHNRLHAVWGHRDTSIYCRPECHVAQRANPLKMVMFADAEHAKQGGMRPCKVCRPSE